MGPQGGADRRRQHEHPAATVGLGLEQLELPGHPRQRVADPEATRLEVDVLPAQAQQLPLAQARAQRGDVQRAEPVLSRSLDEPAGLLRCERLDLVARHPRRVDQLGHIARDESPSLRRHERPPEHRVEVLDAPG